MVISKTDLYVLLADLDRNLENSVRIIDLPTKIECIGQGTFAKVYKYKLSEGNLVAGKKPFINLRSRTQEEDDHLKKTIRRVLRELNILKQLSHQRIITFIGCYWDADKFLLFTELMEGGSVHDLLRSTPLSEISALRYFVQAAEGLSFLHSRKPEPIIHRDIKCTFPLYSKESMLLSLPCRETAVVPSIKTSFFNPGANLLIDKEGNLKLADFGTALDITLRDGKTNAVQQTITWPYFAGTILYAAPEVLKNYAGEKVSYGTKADVWSLACALVEMLTTAPPYREEFLKKGEHKFAKRVCSKTEAYLYGDHLIPNSDSVVVSKNLLKFMFVKDENSRPSIIDVMEYLRGLLIRSSDIKHKQIDSSILITSITNDDHAWKESVMKKLLEHFSGSANREDLIRISYYLNKEDEDDFEIFLAWFSLKSTLVGLEEQFRANAQNLANKTKTQHMERSFQEYMANLKDLMTIKAELNNESKNSDQLVKRALGSCIGFLSGVEWTCGGVGFEIVAYLANPRVYLTAADEVFSLIVSRGGDAICGAIMVAVAWGRLLYVMIKNIKRWRNHEITLRRCIKNTVDSLISVSAGVGGGIKGAMFGALFGPVGAVIGGIVGGIVATVIADGLCSTFMHRLFRIPKEESVENALNFLGVKESASPDEIRAAIRKLRLKYHPDKGGSSEDFVKLTACMEIIEEEKCRVGSPKSTSIWRRFKETLNIWSRFKPKDKTAILMIG